MESSEHRYRVISTLLQAGEPLTAGEIADRAALGEKPALAQLRKLVDEGVVVAGRLLPDGPAPQYCWAARWASRVERGASEARRKLQAVVAAEQPTLEIDSDAVVAFNDFVLHEYKPPKDKRFCVFFQCSVRRPFSKSPSHGSMRRAVTVATGCEPRKDFDSCPVHVVVLASKIGPVPYELEDVYPANVGGGGVKHFGDEYYARVKPILARRLADYLTTHRRSYDRIATFTQGRYGEVMREARRLAGRRFPVLPTPDGPTVSMMGESKPRTYWQKYWIQLYLEIVRWLKPAQRAEAARRLEKLKVKYA